MRGSLLGRVLACSGLLLLLAACSDDSGVGGTYTRPDASDAGDGAQDDDQGAPDQGTPDQGTPDQGTPDQGTPDQPPVDQGPDNTVVDTGPDNTVVDTGPDCAIDTSFVAIPSEYFDGDGGSRSVRLIIEAVDFDNDIVFIRNVTNLIGTNETIDFSDEWRIAYNISGATLISARDLPPGGRMAIHLRTSGFNRPTDTYLNLGGNAWNLTACGGEVVIQDRTGQGTTDWSDHPGNVEAFVRWGDRPVFASTTATFTDEAFDAGAWLEDYSSSVAAAQVCWGDDESVSWCDGETPTCEGMANDQAIIAVGDVRDPEDWLSAPASQFAGCP